MASKHIGAVVLATAMALSLPVTASAGMSQTGGLGGGEAVEASERHEADASGSAPQV